MNSISFLNSNNEHSLLNKGWFTLPVLSETEVSDLISLFHRFHSPHEVPPPFTLCSPDYNKKKDIFLELKNHFAPKMDAIFQRYRLTGANFYFKSARSSANTVPPHQDWTFVDERESYSLNVWVPLMDVDKINGAYHIIEASHKLAFTYRGSNIPSACRNINCNFDEMQYIPLRKGEAILYDHRLIHATPPNASDTDRISIVLNLVPDDATLLHCIQPVGGSGNVDIYKVDEEFYWKYTFSYALNTMPQGYDKLSTEEYDIPDILQQSGAPAN